MTGAPQKPLGDYRRILVIKLGALGDFFQAMGAMRRIRAVHKDAHITLMTTKPFEALARQCGYFDDIYLDIRPKWSQPAKWAALRRFLKSGFERVYDMQNSERTSLYHFMTAPHRPEWVGIAKGASHRDTTKDRRAVHIYETLKTTMAAGGVTGIEVDPLDWLGRDAVLPELPRPFVLIVPGSSPAHPQKRWGVQDYITMCHRLVGRGYTPVVIGTAAEADTTGQIAAACTQAIDLTGKTGLGEIAALGRAAAGALGNDTGPIHMLGPTGCPCLALYRGSSNPARFHPLGPVIATLQGEPVTTIPLEDVDAALSAILR